MRTRRIHAGASSNYVRPAIYVVYIYSAYGILSARQNTQVQIDSLRATTMWTENGCTSRRIGSVQFTTTRIRLQHSIAHIHILVDEAFVQTHIMLSKYVYITLLWCCVVACLRVVSGFWRLFIRSAYMRALNVCSQVDIRKNKHLTLRIFYTARSFETVAV